MEDLKRRMESDVVQFERQWMWVALAVLGWGYFWVQADLHAEHPHTQHMAWIAIMLAVMAAHYL